MKAMLKRLLRTRHGLEIKREVLAFTDSTVLLSAKVGVFAASTPAAVAGWLVLRKAA